MDVSFSLVVSMMKPTIVVNEVETILQHALRQLIGKGSVISNIVSIFCIIFCQKRKIGESICLLCFEHYEKRESLRREIFAP